MIADQHRVVVTQEDSFKASVAPLQSLCTGIFDCPHSTPVWTSLGKVVLRNFNIRNGRLDLSDISYTDERHYAERIRRAEPSHPDIVITREAPMGEVAMIPPNFQCCLGQRLVLLRPDTSKVDPRFLLFALQSKDVQAEIMESEGTGSTVSNLRIPNLANLRIPLPDRATQQRIGVTLGALDEKIELNRRTNETLEEMARATFRAWFVDFLPVKGKVNGETSFPGMDQSVFKRLADGFENGSNDLCPIGWQLQPISGAFYVNPERRIRPGTIATYLDMKNMPTAGSSAIDWVDREFTGSGMRFSNGDTLVARITPCLENGKTAFVDFLNDGEVAWGSTEYVVLRPKPPFPLETAYLLAREDTFREFAVRHMSGTSGRQRFPAAALGGYFIAVPPPEVAAAFEDRIRPMFGAIKNNSRENRVLSATRDLLLRHLFANS